MQQTVFSELPVGALFLDLAMANMTKAIMDLTVYEKSNEFSAKNIYWTNKYESLFNDYFDPHDKVLVLDDTYITELEYKLEVLNVKVKTYQEIVAKYCLQK